MILSSDELSAVRLSVQVSLVAVAVSLPFAVLAGWVLARRRFSGKVVLETAINLPLVLPPVVTGYLLLVSLGRNGWLGGVLDRWFGLRLVFTWQAATLAAAVVAFPLMVRAIRLAFSGVDPRLEAAARTLGAGRLDAFFSVSLPLARRGIIAGCVLGFARSIGEFGATIMIAGNIPGRTQTIPLFIYDRMDTPSGVTGSWRLVVVAVIIAAAALAAGEWLERRHDPNS